MKMTHRNARRMVLAALVCLTALAGVGGVLFQLEKPLIAHAATYCANSPCKQNATWSGYQVYADTFQAIKGDWITQCATLPISTDRLGTWVGIGGGASSKALVQTGTEWESGGYHPFTAYVLKPTNDLHKNLNLTIPCGTHVSAQIWWTGPQPYDTNQWCTSLKWPDGTYTYTYSWCFSNAPDQSTAEWIDERLQVNGNVYCSTLLDFNHTDFSNGYAESRSRGWHTIGGFSRYALQLKDYHYGTIIAESEDLPTGTTAFRDDWKGSGWWDRYNC